LRATLDALIESAEAKPARRYALGQHIEALKMLRDDVYVLKAVGRPETPLAAARAYYFDVMGDLWATLLDGRQLSARMLLRLRYGCLGLQPREGNENVCAHLSLRPARRCVAGVAEPTWRLVCW
jgi:hypothetical protein